MRQFDGLGRRVGAGAGNYRNAAGYMLYRGFDQRTMFFIIDRRRFAGGANDDDAVRTFGNMPVEQAPQTLQVKRTVVMHRRQYGGNGTLYGLHVNIRNGKPDAAANGVCKRLNSN
jgi:hypothetical protein